MVPLRACHLLDLRLDASASTLERSRVELPPISSELPCVLGGEAKGPSRIGVRHHKLQHVGVRRRNDLCFRKKIFRCAIPEADRLQRARRNDRVLRNDALRLDEPVRIAFCARVDDPR